MEKTKIILFALFLFLLPSFSYAAGECYLASDFGNDLYNGIYEDSLSSVNSKPYYINSNTKYLYYETNQNGVWVVSNSTAFTGPYDYYTDVIGITPDTTLWNVGVDDPPAGITELSDCDVATTTTATSTSATTNDVVFGLYILITIAFIYLIAYIGNTLFTKKSWRY